jgi:N-dimethylarginine dimethylaminohydrolase
MVGTDARPYSLISGGNTCRTGLLTQVRLFSFLSYNGFLMPPKINTTVLMSGADFFDDGQAINPFMDKTVKIDIEKAKAEHQAIAEALKSAGVEVKTVPPPQSCQDGVYTANWALVRGEKAVLSTLPNARKNEEPYAEKILKDLGKKVFYMPEALRGHASSSWAFSRRGMEQAVYKYGEVNPAGEKGAGAEEASGVGGSAGKQAGRHDRVRFSGQGDALPCGNYLFMGTGYRTEKAAHDFVAQTLGYQVISLQTIPKKTWYGKHVINKYSGWPDSYFYDIDLALSVLRFPSQNQKGLIAWCPEAFVPQSRKFLKAFDGVEKIEVEFGEAKVGFACNLVSTGETVVMSAHAPKFKAKLESLGFKVITPEITELAKGGGFIRCTTLTLNNP